MFINTGEYIEQKGSSISQSTFYTFTPHPLLNGNFYTMDDKLSSALIKTHRLLGVLEGIEATFPDKEMLSELILFKESCFSRAIDYSVPELSSALINRALGRADSDVDNILSAHRHVLESKSVSTDFDDVARCALYGIDSSEKTGTRTQPMFLTKSTSNFRQYNPTSPQRIKSALDDIKNYIDIDSADPLIKSAMSHYQFEMIHPYNSYNGIIGRILAYKMLADAGLSGIRYLSLSECLYIHKTEYFETLAQTQKSGHYAAWIDFFVRIISESAQEAVNSARDYMAIIRSDTEKLAAHTSRLQYAVDVYNHFRKNIVSTVGMASVQLHLSFNAVSRVIEALCSIGILKKITDQPRNRLFAHTAFMQLILTE